MTETIATALITAIATVLAAYFGSRAVGRFRNGGQSSRALPAVASASPPQSSRETDNGGQLRNLMARMRQVEQRTDLFHQLEIRMVTLEQGRDESARRIQATEREQRELRKELHDYQRANERELGAIAARLDADD